ncbi:hypothetical protein LSTR_LSTR005365 [Laodelphax striatellus]|uniref:BRCT domain-containing protein n=1 Tax=Laodelphax striatellus TaxID=195883 RepID=A0A482XGL4_LAOST|nr:hypothetical protein LSTR_LSTR005365 [Laodelphax striatellus]
MGKESTITCRELTTTKESTMTCREPTATGESTMTLRSEPTGAEERTVITFKEPTVDKENTIITCRESTAAEESTMTLRSEQTAAEESTIMSSRSTAAEESTMTPSSLAVAKESTMAPSGPALAKESTMTSSRFTDAKESTMTPSRFTDAKKSTMTPSSPALAKESTMTPSRFTDAKESTMTPSSPAVAKESTMMPTTSWGGQGIETPYLNLNTSSISTDSDAESSYFPPILVVFSQCRRHIDVWRSVRSSDTESNDSERELRTPGDDVSRMDVLRLTRQVQAGGGEVYKRLHQVPRHMRDNLYLISDGPSRSPLYLACIMLGVPLVSYTAVINACQERQNFKQLVHQDRHFFCLPIGWSDETGRKIIRKPEKRPFAGIRVAYACDSGNHVTHTFWREILARMGAHVVDGLAPTQHVDIVVSDGSSNTHARENTPIVNCNWIVHSLMYGSCRQANASPLYSAEYH